MAYRWDTYGTEDSSKVLLCWPCKPLLLPLFYSEKKQNKTKLGFRAHACSQLARADPGPSPSPSPSTVLRSGVGWRVELLPTIIKYSHF